MSTSLALIDVGNSVAIKDEHKIKTIEFLENSFIRNKYIKLWDILKNIKSVPIQDEIKSMSEFIQSIYDELDVGWYKIEKGYYVFQPSSRID